MATSWLKGTIKEIVSGDSFTACLHTPQCLHIRLHTCADTQAQAHTHHSLLTATSSKALVWCTPRTGLTMREIYLLFRGHSGDCRCCCEVWTSPREAHHPLLPRRAQACE